MRKKNKGLKKFFIWLAVVVGVGASAFMITSLAMASNNCRSLKEEWQSWKPAVEETVETPDEETEDVVIEEETAEENAA